jgi:hypothetical protein
MRLLSWLHERMTGRSPRRRAPVRRPTSRFRPQVRALEDRVLLSFSAPVSYPETGPVAVVAADVNGDGKPDLIAVDGPLFNTVSVRLNNGNGTFGPARTFYNSLYETAAAMAVGDVNGDGKPDLVLADTFEGTPDPTAGGGAGGSVYVLLGDGQGNFAPGPGGVQGIFWAPPTSIALADVDGDGKPDIVAGESGGLVEVARNEGQGFFANAQFVGGVGNHLLHDPCVVQVVAGGFNGNGKPDIVVADPRLSSVSVLPNNGDGTFGAAQTYAVGGPATGVAVGDFNRDGKPDIVTANSNGTVSVLPNTGNGTFGAAQTFAVGGPANSVAVGDFNHDGLPDIATTGAEMDVLLNAGNGSFGAYQKVGPAGSSVVAADFNGNGFPGLAQIDASSSGTDVVLNNADWMPGPVAVSFGSITYSSNRGLYSETVTLTNTSSGTLAGPMSLELTNLPPGVTLTDASGTANGNPYVRFLKSGKTLKPGASLSITLTFTAPSLGDIDFGTEVVAL